MCMVSNNAGVVPDRCGVNWTRRQSFWSYQSVYVTTLPHGSEFWVVTVRNCGWLNRAFQLRPFALNGTSWGGLNIWSGCFFCRFSNHIQLKRFKFLKIIDGFFPIYCKMHIYLKNKLHHNSQLLTAGRLQLHLQQQLRESEMFESGLQPPLSLKSTFWPTELNAAVIYHNLSGRNRF